ENNVEVSLPASVVNQANPKPASNEVRVVSSAEASRSTPRRSARFEFSVASVVIMRTPRKVCPSPWSSPQDAKPSSLMTEVDLGDFLRSNHNHPSNLGGAKR